MQLIGMMDSPYVRRVAVSLKLMGLPFEHRSVSVFRHFNAFAAVNPLVKAPTLVADDGAVLMESSLILDYAEARPDKRVSLMPSDLAGRTRALRLIGLALIACEKSVQFYYENALRPEERRHQPWLDRVQAQLEAAYAELEREVTGAGEYLAGSTLSQADVSVAVAWTFSHFIGPGQLDPTRYPALAAFVPRIEALPEFASSPLE